MALKAIRSCMKRMQMSGVMRVVVKWKMHMVGSQMDSSRVVRVKGTETESEEVASEVSATAAADSQRARAELSMVMLRGTLRRWRRAYRLG